MAMMIPATHMAITTTAITKKPAMAMTITINPRLPPTPITIAATYSSFCTDIYVLCNLLVASKLKRKMYLKQMTRPIVARSLRNA
uniref:Uncharacterized protein n=1 Tax=Romanomermis culicivorax TaxID=13658 RepID=A0A915IBC8_ROMCU